MAGYTATEKVGFAFYSLINSAPPIDRWIETREDYITAKPKVRIAMMDAERIRLQKGFSGYIPGRDMIMIRVKVRLTATENPDSSRTLEINFSDFDQILYFPFRLGDLWVALLPAGLEAKSAYRLTAEDYDGLSSVIGMGEGMAELVFIPTRADGGDPMVVGDIPLWPMMADVAQFSIFDREGNAVWRARSSQRMGR